MRQYYILFLACCCYLFSNSQELSQSFSEAIATHLPKYNKKVNRAYEEQNYTRANFLFDSIVENHLKNTYLDDFNVSSFKKNKTNITDYEKPVFLITYASWCIPTEGEIPALNQLAKSYKDDIAFVVLFWDKKENVKKAAKDYNRFVDILYVDELENKYDNVVSKLKHSLGFPTTFFLDSQKKILDISRPVFHPLHLSYAESYNLNFNDLSQGVSLLLSKGNEDLNQNLVGF